MTTTGDGAGPPGKELFAQVQFCIIPSPGLKGEEADLVGYFRLRYNNFTHMYWQLAKTLVENGAVQYSQPPTEEKLPLDKITHLVSTTSDFPDYEAAISALKAVVKPDWVQASLLKGRLANPRSYSPDPRLFFSGLVVCCADLPPGDKDAIIGGVIAMGGLYSSPLSKLVTHIVALTLDPEKCQTARAKNLKCKIVLPHWQVPCPTRDRSEP